MGHAIGEWESLIKRASEATDANNRARRAIFRLKIGGIIFCVLQVTSMLAYIDATARHRVRAFQEVRILEGKVARLERQLAASRAIGWFALGPCILERGCDLCRLVSDRLVIERHLPFIYPLCEKCGERHAHPHE